MYSMYIYLPLVEFYFGKCGEINDMWSVYYVDTKIYLKIDVMLEFAQSWKKTKKHQKENIIEVKLKAVHSRTLPDPPQLHVIFLCLLEMQRVIALDDTIVVSCFPSGFPSPKKTHVSTK